MPDRGRDVEVSILSDLNKFDLEPGARELEKLGDAAKDAERQVEDSLDGVGRGFDQVGDDAKAGARKVDDAADKIGAAGKGVDRFGDQAKATAGKVDDAFDAIAKSARASSRKVDDSMDDARKGLDDFKDEAAGSGKEAAASFGGGFEDVADFVQETAANALAGMGKVGAAAGVAAAVGIGILTSQLEASKERIKEVRDALFQLGQDGATAFDRQKDALDRLQGAGELANYRDAVKNVGASWEDFVNGMAGDDAALERVRVKASEASSSYLGLGTAFSDAAKGGQVLETAIGEQRDATALANADLAAYTDGLTAHAEAEGTSSEAIAYNKEVLDAATAAEQARKDALDSTVSSIAQVADASTGLSGVIQEEAQKQADATKDPKDSWSDYADTVDLSAKEIIKTLDEQTKAAEDFRDNLLEVQKRGDEEFLAWVSQQPPAVAAAYADGTAKEKSGIYAAWKRNVGAAAGDGIVDGMTSKRPAAASAAASVHEDMRAELKRRIDVPVGVTGPTGSELARVRAGIRQGLAGIQVGVTAIAQTVSSRSVP